MPWNAKSGLGPKTLRCRIYEPKYKCRSVPLIYFKVLDPSSRNFETTTGSGILLHTHCLAVYLIGKDYLGGHDLTSLLATVYARVWNYCFTCKNILFLCGFSLSSRLPTYCAWGQSLVPIGRLAGWLAAPITNCSSAVCIDNWKQTQMDSKTLQSIWLAGY